MDPGRFLEIAQVLRAGPPRAEYYRTAIGRAYYAAFHVGLQTLVSMGIHPNSDAGAHEDVRNCLGASTDRDIQKAGIRLRSLYARRRKADYDLRVCLERSDSGFVGQALA